MLQTLEFSIFVSVLESVETVSYLPGGYRGGNMLIVIVILLGLMLIALISLMSVLWDVRTFIESINTHTAYIEGSLREVAYQVCTLTDSAKEIDSAVADIQENVQKHETDKVIEILREVELALSDLRPLADDMARVKESLDTVTSHPAFAHYR